MARPRLTVALCSAIAVALAGAAGGSTSPAEPSLPDVLSRAGSYVTEFERRLSAILAEEHYEQIVTCPGSTRALLRRRERSYRI
jgi:hypothetical protein